MYSYADAMKPWLVILTHIPIVLSTLIFLSRQVSLRTGEMKPRKMKIVNNTMLRRVFLGCLVGFITLIILSPMSRMILAGNFNMKFLPN